MRDAGGRGRRRGTAVRRRTTAGPGSWSRGTTPRDHAERMLQILRDPALAERLGVAAAREALRFTWDATAAELAGIYRELLTASAMIRGERVTLRPVEERDYPLIHAWQNDPEVWWLMDYESPFSLADIAESEKRAHRGGVPVHHRGRRAPDRPDRDQQRPPPGPDLRALRLHRRALGVGQGARDGRDRHDAGVRVLAVRPPSGRALVVGGQRARAPRLRALRVPRGGAARGTLMEGRTVGRSGRSCRSRRENFDAARMAREQRER